MGKKKTRQKHVPIRMCIVTKKRKPKKELMRLVRVDDKVVVDPKGKERGRGANISMDVKVFDEAIKKHLIERALKLERKLTKEEVQELKKDFKKGIEEREFRDGRKPVVLKVDKKEWRSARREGHGRLRGQRRRRAARANAGAGSGARDGGSGTGRGGPRVALRDHGASHVGDPWWSFQHGRRRNRPAFRGSEALPHGPIPRHAVAL